MIAALTPVITVVVKPRDKHNPTNALIEAKSFTVTDTAITSTGGFAD
jgi:hypothetical protein